MARRLRAVWLLAAAAVASVGLVLVLEINPLPGSASAQGTAPASIQGPWEIRMGLGEAGPGDPINSCYGDLIDITQSDSTVSAGNFGCLPSQVGGLAVTGGPLTGTYSGGTIDLTGPGYFFPPGDIYGSAVTLRFVGSWTGDWFLGSWGIDPVTPSGRFSMEPKFPIFTPTPPPTDTPMPTATDTPTPTATATPAQAVQAIETIQRLVDRACEDPQKTHQCAALQSVLDKLGNKP